MGASLVELGSGIGRGGIGWRASWRSMGRSMGGFVSWRVGSLWVGL